MRRADDLFFLVRVRGDLVGQAALVLSDAFGKAGAEDGVGIHFQQLVFAGRGARIDDQNFHVPSFSCWQRQGADGPPPAVTRLAATGPWPFSAAA